MTVGTRVSVSCCSAMRNSRRPWGLTIGLVFVAVAIQATEPTSPSIDPVAEVQQAREDTAVQGWEQEASWVCMDCREPSLYLWGEWPTLFVPSEQMLRDDDAFDQSRVSSCTSFSDTTFP